MIPHNVKSGLKYTTQGVIRCVFFCQSIIVACLLVKIFFHCQDVTVLLLHYLIAWQIKFDGKLYSTRWEISDLSVLYIWIYIYNMNMNSLFNKCI